MPSKNETRLRRIEREIVPDRDGNAIPIDEYRAAVRKRIEALPGYSDLIAWANSHDVLREPVKRMIEGFVNTRFYGEGEDVVLCDPDIETTVEYRMQSIYRRLRRFVRAVPGLWPELQIAKGEYAK